MGRLPLSTRARTGAKSEGKEWNEAGRTSSSGCTLVVVNQSWSSLWRVVTSSTEHFLAATLATLSSSLRVSARTRAQLASIAAVMLLLAAAAAPLLADAVVVVAVVIVGKRSSLRVGRSPGMSWASIAPAPPPPPRRREAMKPTKEGTSTRIRRMESLENCSRQKGQTGVRRGDVFSMMLLQQAAHKT